RIELMADRTVPMAPRMAETRPEISARPAARSQDPAEETALMMAERTEEMAFRAPETPADRTAPANPVISRTPAETSAPATWRSPERIAALIFRTAPRIEGMARTKAAARRTRIENPAWASV